MRSPLRRALSLVGCISALALLTSTANQAAPAKDSRWSIEPTILRDNNRAASIVEVDLVAKTAMVQFVPGGVMTEVWTYNGLLPGPTIQANVGDTLIVNFVNLLPEETSVHWHGVEVPATMDGTHLSQSMVPPGGTFRYEFKLLKASLFWYHPHSRSDVQVEKGLYGALFVRDPAADAALGLPSDGHLLLLDDILLDDIGAVEPPNPNGPDSPNFDPLKHIVMQANGREGNTLLVNGRANVAPPTVQVGVPLRLRIVNTANTRFMRLSIPGHDVYRIGGDGGLLTAPLKQPPISTEPHPCVMNETISKRSILGFEEGIILTPGERADIVFTPRGTQIRIELHDFFRGRHAAYMTADPMMRYPEQPNWEMCGGTPPMPMGSLESGVGSKDKKGKSDGPGAFHIAPPPGAMFGLDYDITDGYAPARTILTLNGKVPRGGASPTDYVPPAALRSIPRIPSWGARVIESMFGHTLPEEPTGNITFFMHGDMDMPMPFDMVTPEMAPSAAPGEVVIWEVHNMGGGYHNFHLHGFTFQVLEYEFIDMERPEYNFTLDVPFIEEKDTVMLPGAPGSMMMSRSITRLAVRFDDTGREGQIEASGKMMPPMPGMSGGWMVHCHLLEHASLGMMSFLQIMNDPPMPPMPMRR